MKRPLIAMATLAVAIPIGLATAGVGSAATPTVGSLVSCLKANGATDLSVGGHSATVYGSVSGSVWTGPAAGGRNFNVVLFDTVAAANASAAKNPAESGGLLDKANGGQVLIYLDSTYGEYPGKPANYGITPTQAVLSKCLTIQGQAAPAPSSPSTSARPSNPNTVSALVACLRTGKASKITTPSSPPAYGTVAAYAPSGPSVVVFLFDKVAQANSFLSVNEVGNGASVFKADGGLTLIYINKGTAAAVSAAKTLIADCIK